MAVINWIITNIDGEIVGQHCQIKSSSTIKSFNDFIPPAGYKKSLISQDDYEILETSFNRDRKIYEHYVVGGKLVELAEERKVINELKAKPNKYIERLTIDGNLVKEFYDKDGNLDRTQIVDKDGKPVEPKKDYVDKK